MTILAMTNFVYRSKTEEESAGCSAVTELRSTLGSIQVDIIKKNVLYILKYVEYLLCLLRSSSGDSEKAWL